MYISGGEDVYPAEVEKLLADTPARAEAAVIGVADHLAPGRRTGYTWAASVMRLGNPTEVRG